MGKYNKNLGSLRLTIGQLMIDGIQNM